MLFQIFFEFFFFGLINSPDPPDYFPGLEAYEIVVKVFQIYDQMLKIAVFRAYLGGLRPLTGPCWIWIKSPSGP